jgi:hypothetical protein
MFKTRIASIAALATFGLAALGGTGAPAYAAPDTDSSDHSGNYDLIAKMHTARSVLIGFARAKHAIDSEKRHKDGPSAPH